MSFTIHDLDAINRAIASGELTVRADSGRMITMRTMAELIEARSMILRELQASQTQHSRAYPRHQLADFSDD